MSRVKTLDEQSLVAVVIYLLARYPHTSPCPAVLDDALSTLSSRADS